MTLLGLIALFCLTGVVMWLVNAYVPMPQQIKTVLNIAVVIVLVLYVISATGLLGPLNVPIGRIR